jgi:hypothetical protein
MHNEHDFLKDILLKKEKREKVFLSLDISGRQLSLTTLAYFRVHNCGKRKIEFA